MTLEERNKLVKNTSVIEKVKPITSINNCGYFSIQQLSDYFDVKYNTIQKIIQRHAKEFGKEVVLLSTQEIINLFGDKKISIVNNRYYTLITSEEDHITIRVGNNVTNMIKLKGVIRIALFLTNSPLANRIREALLNPEKEVHTREIEIVKTDLQEIDPSSSNQELIEKLKTAYANFGYAIKNDVNSISECLANIKAIEGETPDYETEIKSLKAQVENLKAIITEKDQQSQVLKKHLIIGFLTVIMKQMQITPGEMVLLMDEILPKEY